MKKQLLLTALIFMGNLNAQTSAGDKISVPFSDPSRPGFIELGLVGGSITVKGYDGKEVLIEAKTRGQNVGKHKHKSKDGDQQGKARGMIRLNIASTGLSVEEENNQMSISAESHIRSVDFVLQVPQQTSLQLSTVNDGDIFVEGVTGELELSNVNGGIKAHNIAGAVLSNTTNGDISVTFSKTLPDKPMSFVSFNGDVDVTFPGPINAEFKLKTQSGEIYTDFEIELEERSKVTREDNRRQGGQFRLEIESAMYAKVGKGGPEYYFSTYNGKIYIRKKG